MKEHLPDEASCDLVEKEAATAVAEVLSGPSAWWRERARRTPGVLTCGCVELLVQRSIALLDQSPADAVEAAAVAADVAERLAAEAGPSGLVAAVRADAWREYAYSLFYIGRLAEASDALDRAEQACRQSASPELGLARIALIRASLYRAADRIEEAIALTEEAGEVFQRLGDVARYAKARITEGNMRYARGAVAAALAIWLSLEDVPGIAEDGTLGMVLHNIGCAYRDLGDPAKARTYLGRASAQYEARGMVVEKIRTRYAEGGMLVMSGAVAEGLPILREAWRAFERVGMELEAALVGLEVAEALLATGDSEEVPSICRAMLDRFVSEGMTSRAITALSFLREAVAVGKASPDLVRNIHSFLRALPDGAKNASTPAAV
ncbi:MAG: MalT-like region [Acidobacteriota bacterium]|jgi:tetratricopeptide (TPR) repeat protein|nr:MalT-like region [Acidobacteriota bacterium]